jgi:hypothetical protein
MDDAVGFGGGVRDYAVGGLVKAVLESVLKIEPEMNVNKPIYKGKSARNHCSSMFISGETEFQNILFGGCHLQDDSHLMLKMGLSTDIT